MCRVLEVSPAGYYAWRSRPESSRSMANRELLANIRSIATVMAAMAARASMSSSKRKGMARAEAGSNDRCATMAFEPSWPGPGAAALPIAAMAFQSPRTWLAATSAARNQIWLADITYIETGQGWLYLAAIIDVYSRRIVGWAMADHLRAELPLAALQMAIK